MAAAQADFATLVVPHGDDEVIVAAASGALAAPLAGRTASSRDSLAGRAIRTGKPALVLDYHDEAAEIALPLHVGPLIVVPLAAGEHVRGALTLGRLTDQTGFTETDLTMAASFATQAAVALELADARDAHARLSRTEDRDRIAGTLNERVVQELFALGMGLQGLATITDRQADVARIVGYIDSIDTMISSVRASILQLRSGHRDAGPEATSLRTRILDLADAHAAELGFAPQVRFIGPCESMIGDAIAADILAVIRTAISNCARRAHASCLGISLQAFDTQVILDVTDNGRGLGASTMPSGLISMRERAELHHGTFTVVGLDNGGTHLRWTARLVDAVGA